MTRAQALETALPVEREVAAAVESQRALAAFLSTQFETQRIQIFDAKNQAHQVELPTSALRLLVDVLSELAEGNAVKVVPIHAELTTQEAADMLNVSRPHLVKLLESGALAFHKTGKHRRIRFADLMAFKTEQDRASAQAMEALASVSVAGRTLWSAVYDMSAEPQWLVPDGKGGLVRSPLATPFPNRDLRTLLRLVNRRPVARSSVG